MSDKLKTYDAPPRDQPVKSKIRVSRPKFEQTLMGQKLEAALRGK